MRIPFDSFTLAAIVKDLTEFVGGRVQGIRQPTETDVVLELYASGREGLFHLSTHAEFFRCHFVTRRSANTPSPLQFCSALRAKIGSATFVAVEQPPHERILVMTFESSDGVFHLIAELMGKHSNIILINSNASIVAAAKWVPPSKTSRPIQPLRTYEAPATAVDARGSKFYRRLLEATNGEIPPYGPVLVPGVGAYPVSVAALGLTGFPRATISIALESYFAEAIVTHRLESVRSSLLGHVDRAILAREVSVHDLSEAIQTSGRATKWQLCGDLILAYGSVLFEGQDLLEAYDYEGNLLQIPLDPQLNFKENANAYFSKARKAKDRLPFVRTQLLRHTEELSALRTMRNEVAEATRYDDLADLEDRARAKKWLRIQSPVASKGPAKPGYEGYRIREFTAPKGATVLVGENSESNDYLTMRVAKNDDLWLHVRGHTSGHVVIPTQRHPERIAREDLIFAAQVAVMHSNQKHGSYIPVDYTLKKFVRKPRGSAKGAVTYTNEKTLYVDPIER